MVSSISLLPPLVSLCSNLLLLPHPPPPTPVSLSFPQVQPAPRPYNLIYHRPTNSCVFTDATHSPPALGPCTSSDLWYYTPQHLLIIKSAYYCLRYPARPGLPPRPGVTCAVEDSQWNFNSAEPRRISTPDGNLCLDVGSDGSSIVVNPCDSSSESQSFEVLNVGKDGRVPADHPYP